MTKMYEVWTCYKGECGVQLFRGTKKECNQYTKQAIQKGAKPNHLVTLFCGYKP